MTVIPFEPDRFRSAARHYFARPEYSTRLIGRVIADLALSRDDRVLDLGCGPGPLAIAFAPFVGQVVAVDPNAEMREVGRRAARGRADNVFFVGGSSNDLGDQFGRFRLVTMGRSFHWMDRAATLARLDQIVEPDGAVALFNVAAVNEGRDHWHRQFDEIVNRYSVQPPVWRSTEWPDQTAILVDSAFGCVDGFSAAERVNFPADRLADRALSMSRTSPDALGPDKAAAMTAEVHALAASVAKNGFLTEILESQVTIGRRP